MDTNLWDVNCHRFENEPLTDEMVEHTEVKLGIKLPKEYIDLMRERNGGNLRYVYFSVPEESSSALGRNIMVNHIMGIGKDEGGILQASYFIKEFGLKTKLIPFYGDGDSWLCFDYNKGGPFKEPVISYIRSHSKQTIEISPDFKTFINGLKEQEN